MSGEALLLVGHGSHLNPRSAEPTYEHAETVRESGLFDEVRTAFWKEEPSLREALRTVRSSTVYVVPLFISEGYFVDEVIPRELRIAEGWELKVDKEVRYTPPVGTHDSMTDVVVERAKSIMEVEADVEDAGLAVVGHGTERNTKSADAVYRHAERVRGRDGFAEVKALFMDEEPEIGDLTEHFSARDVVVVPLFVADGYHTQEDIPEDAGLVGDHREGWDVPAEVDGHRVWYSGAVGTEDLVADVVVERAVDAGAGAQGSVSVSGVGELTEHERAFIERVDESDGELRWGELVVFSRDDGYELRNVGDADAETKALDRHGPEEARELVRLRDESDGRYRPLKGERSLPTGWRIDCADEAELLNTVGIIYPASIPNASLEDGGRLDVTPWDETAERQTGIYEGVEELEGGDLESAISAVCGNCVKRCEWHTDGASDEEGDVIPCREACSFFVAAARSFLTMNDEEPMAASDKVRVGGFSEPGNLYRKRYLEASARKEEEGEMSVETISNG